jgi:hypothetical protein
MATLSSLLLWTCKFLLRPLCHLPLGFGKAKQDTPGEFRLSGAAMRDHLFFSTPPGNANLYVAQKKVGIIRNLPARPTRVLFLLFHYFILPCPIYSMRRKTRQFIALPEFRLPDEYVEDEELTRPFRIYNRTRSDTFTPFLHTGVNNLNYTMERCNKSSTRH